MKTIVILSCVVLGIAAYNFDDAVYNAFLAKDYESLSEDDGLIALHPRARRDEKAAECHNRKSRLCCGEEELTALNEEYRDVRKQCFKEVTGSEFFHAKPFDPFSCEDIEQRKKELICVKECVGKKSGLADENGDLNEDEVRKYATKHYTLEWLAPKLDETLTKCFAEAKEATQQMKKSKDACNPANLKFNHCMFREIQLGCPNDKIEDQNTCAIIRQMAEHSSFFIPHVPHP